MKQWLSSAATDAVRSMVSMNFPNKWGISWYWWADVPIRKQQNVYVKPGQYTDGEPAVTYRGIFLNDEAPCLTGWVKQTYGTNYGDHRFIHKFTN